ncbi:MAG TPA: TonB-dependent receptor [Gemmatimonadales bacterium]
MKIRQQLNRLMGGAAIAATATLLLPMPAAAQGSSAATPAPGAARRPAPAPQGGIVAGVVVDSATGRPLAAARVRLVGLERGEATHDDGTFRFARVPVGAQTISIQRLGYAPAVRMVPVQDGDSVFVRVSLVASAAQLSSVVVTGTVGERLGDELLSPTSVLSGAELDRRLSGTVAGTVEREPGVSVVSTGPNTARPVIRGLGGDRILLLEDGMRPGDLSSTSGDHAVAIEPLTAQKVEVVRGPMSLLYGPNALGGVVNVVREEIPTTAPEHPHGMASLEGSTVNRGVGAGGWGTAGVGRVALRGEASVRDANDLRTPAGRLTNTQSRTYNLSGGAALTGDWGHAGASYRFYDSEYGIPGGFLGSHEDGVDIAMRRRMVRGDAERRVPWGPFSSLHATGSLTRYDHEELEHAHDHEGETPEEHAGHEDEEELGTLFQQDMAALELMARHGEREGGMQGAIGVRGQWRDVATGGSLHTPDTRDRSLAGFLVEEVAFGPVRLQGGLRYDWSRYVPEAGAFVTVGDERIPALSRTFSAFSGSAGILWQAREWLSVGGSVARAYRTPDFNELYSDGPHLAAYSYDVGDPRLSKETGIGVDGYVRLRTGSVQAELAAFRNTLDDYIYLRNTGRTDAGSGRPVFQYDNTDARLTGAEADVQWSVTPRWVVEASASLVRGELTGPPGTLPADPELGLPERPASRNLPFIPPLNGRAGVRYETPLWFAGAGLRWSDRQDRLGDFETETAGHGVADLDAGLRLLLGGRLHTLTLRVDNAFDREYREHLARTKAVMPQAGTNVSVLYRVMF